MSPSVIKECIEALSYLFRESNYKQVQGAAIKCKFLFDALIKYIDSDVQFDVIEILGRILEVDSD